MENGSPCNECALLCTQYGCPLCDRPLLFSQCSQLLFINHDVAYCGVHNTLLYLCTAGAPCAYLQGWQRLAEKAIATFLRGTGVLMYMQKVAAIVCNACSCCSKPILHLGVP